MSKAAARGFTLVETIIALAIVLMLAGAMFAMLWNITARRDRLAEAGRQRVGLSVLFDQIESDLAGCLAGGGSLPPGVVGESRSLTVLSRGTSIPVALDRSREDLSDLRLATYALRGGEIVAGRVAGVRTPLAAHVQPLIRGVREMRLRYFDGASWSDTFQSQTSGLPVAIEVSVWLGEAQTVEKAVDEGAVEGADTLGGPLTVTGESVSSAGPSAALGPPDRSRIIVVPDAPTVLETRLELSPGTLPPGGSP